MMVTTYTSGVDFLAQAQATLEADEAANNLLLGIAQRLAAGNAPPNWSTPYLATVADAAGQLSLEAVMTPPAKLVLHGEGDVWQPALEPLAHNLLDSGWYVPGVLGPSEVVHAFAETWQTVARRPYRRGMRQRIYELRQVVYRGAAPGCLRGAVADDLDLLAAWFAAFHAEALHETPDPETTRDNAERRILAGDMVVWEDDRQVVSMAARSRPSAHGIAVNAVYTPPELRGRGYATSAVAALSQQLLDAGYEFCCLFTDLGNPTSNRIYQRIGYRPVCDFNEYIF